MFGWSPHSNKLPRCVLITRLGKFLFRAWATFVEVWVDRTDSCVEISGEEARMSAVCVSCLDRVLSCLDRVLSCPGLVLPTIVWSLSLSLSCLVLSCIEFSCFVLSCLSCLFLSCLSCLVLSCLDFSCLDGPWFVLRRPVFYCLGALLPFVVSLLQAQWRC